MTSAIQYTSIDETYPVAGIDNNSQGFRDNFSYIKDALAVAADEITDLQSDTAKTTGDNDFNKNEIAYAETNMLCGKVSGPISSPVGTTTVDVSDGEYQIFEVTAATTTLRFQGWPGATNGWGTPVLGKITLELTSSYTGGATSEITFASLPAPVFKLDNSGEFTSPGTMTIPADTAKTTVIEAWSADGGDTVFLKYVGTFE